MLPLFSSLIILFIFIYLLRKDLVDSEIVAPIFLGFIGLGILSITPSFIIWIAKKTGIAYPPISIILLILFILTLAITSLSIGYTEIRRRQLKIICHLAILDLSGQE